MDRLAIEAEASVKPPAATAATASSFIQLPGTVREIFKRNYPSAARWQASGGRPVCDIGSPSATGRLGRVRIYKAPAPYSSRKDNGSHPAATVGGSNFEIRSHGAQVSEEDRALDIAAVSRHGS
ncbi:hypothetical protein HPB50_022315 [Hyalomma asiaticum]|uniref:Uncharacterized protein n=1 Tax=Hyalomma asiaticum TaxID=266040 RepID=A0ACB7S399_HYAAI|nr:hypothetical protein HPB50_022315 [Hyalomma asiaticum]